MRDGLKCRPGGRRLPRWRGEVMRRLAAAVVVGWLTVLPAAAEPLAREQVPEALRPWTDWVMHGHEEAFCSLLQGSTDHRQCAWPSRLTLDLDARAGRFTQGWLVQRAGWVPLPGDAARAPLDVRADGKPAAVTFRSGVPSVRLERGAHTVSGVFEWDSLPELLPIPAETGLVGLALNGKPVAFPNRDPQGQLWLQRRMVASTEESRLDVVVHRRVIDDIPLQLVTRVELKVAGPGREMLLGRAQPPAHLVARLRRRGVHRQGPDLRDDEPQLAARDGRAHRPRPSCGQRPRAVPDPLRRSVRGGDRAPRGPAPARSGQSRRGRRVTGSSGRLGPRLSGGLGPAQPAARLAALLRLGDRRRLVVVGDELDAPRPVRGADRRHGGRPSVELALGPRRAGHARAHVSGVDGAALAVARRARGPRAGARPARGPPTRLRQALPPGRDRGARDVRARLRGGSGPGRSLSAARDAAARGGTLHSHRRCGAGSSRGGEEGT